MNLEIKVLCSLKKNVIVLSPGVRNSKRVEDKDHSIQMLEVSKSYSVIFILIILRSHIRTGGCIMSIVTLILIVKKLMIPFPFPIFFKKSR